MVVEMNQAGEPRDQTKLQDMQQLLEKAEQFATTVQDELQELNSMRQTALATVQTEADEILIEANQEADLILKRAEEDARSTIEMAKSQAANITQTAQDDLHELRAESETYRQALHTAMTALEALPQRPPQKTEVAALTTADEFRPAQNGRPETAEPAPTFTIVPETQSGMPHDPVS